MRRERERQQREIARRSIEFAGNSLDTGDQMFAERLQEIAAAWLSKDETWFERSRQRTQLVEFQNQAQPSGGSSGGGKGGGTGRRDRQLNDAQRQAMGLASEWLAFRFLRRRQGDFVNETCWISKNRAQFVGGDEGDDTAGYDFRVKTPQADWLYEVKSSLEDSGEFELTANELRVASGASKDGRRRYRILYIPYVFHPASGVFLNSPTQWARLHATDLRWLPRLCAATNCTSVAVEQELGQHIVRYGSRAWHDTDTAPDERHEPPSIGTGRSSI